MDRSFECFVITFFERIVAGVAVSSAAQHLLHVASILDLSGVPDALLLYS